MGGDIGLTRPVVLLEEHLGQAAGEPILVISHALTVEGPTLEGMRLVFSECGFDYRASGGREPILSRTVIHPDKGLPPKFKTFSFLVTVTPNEGLTWGEVTSREQLDCVVTID